MSQPLFLQLRRISKWFGGTRALENVDLELRRGEIHCLVGENGSGKSTLIKIIAGVHSPEPGAEIIIDGVRLSHLTPGESIRRGIQVIYQDLSLFPNLTVAENIGLVQYMDRTRRLVDWSLIRQTARDAMRRLGVSLDLDVPVGQLSVAERQIVAICRAVAAEARLVIMDEPTASLTRREVGHLFEVVRDLSSQGITTLFVSHRLDEVLEIAKRVTVLRDGRKIGTFEAGQLSAKELTVLMTGHEMESFVPEEVHGSGAAALEVRNLTKRGQYQDVSFSLRHGEVLGLTGLLGSGRTELALSLFGMNPPDSGEVLLEGRPIQPRSNKEAVELGIAYVPEDRLTFGLALDQPVDTNIVVTVLRQIVGRFGFVREDRKTGLAQGWVRDLGVKVASLKAPVKTLSGGNQQKVVLAKWLATKPKVLILDSPTVGVDVGARSSIYAIIRDLAAQGMAILLISDEVPEVLQTCHRVLVMRRGRISREFWTHETSEEELSRYVHAG